MQAIDLPWLEELLTTLPVLREKLPQALLLAGRPGLGKGSIAMQLAKGVLCESTQIRRIACTACVSCHLFAAGNHPDFRLLEIETDAAEAAEPESEDKAVAPKAGRRIISVDKIRSLLDFAGMSAHRGRGKAIVIYTAEDMNPSASNAILKILEEPPPDTYFLLVSHQPDRLNATLRSRCFQLKIPAPGVAQIRDWLANMGSENPDLALALADQAPLEAMKLAKDETFWIKRRQLFMRLADARFDPLKAADAVEESDPTEVFRLLSQWVYDLTSVASGLDVRYNLDHKKDLGRLAQDTSATVWFAWYRRLLQFGRSAQHPLNKRLALESLFTAYPVLRRKGKSSGGSGVE
jgi:DNA polymerase III subunit delta'